MANKDKSRSLHGSSEATNFSESLAPNSFFNLGSAQSKFVCPTGCKGLAGKQVRWANEQHNSSLLHSEHLLQRGSLSRLTLLRATTDLILGSDFDFICLDYWKQEMRQRESFRVYYLKFKWNSVLGFWPELNRGPANDYFFSQVPRSNQLSQSDEWVTEDLPSPGPSIIVVESDF